MTTTNDNNTSSSYSYISYPPLPPPRKIVTFDVGGDPKGGAVYLYGDPDSTNIAIFCAGFADDHEIGQEFCSRLSSSSKTLVGLMCLPGYDDRKDKPWTTHKKDGYTFDEMTACIRDAVKVLREESTNNNARLTGFFHDWAVVPGFMWTNRSLKDKNSDSPAQLVIFDVLLPLSKEQMKDIPTYKKATTYEKIVTNTYRLILAISFVIQRYISKYMSIPFVIFGMILLQIAQLSPVFDIDAKIIQSRQPRLDLSRFVYMAYPYYNAFVTFFCGDGKLNDAVMIQDLKKTPVLYLYGTEKRIMFHEDASVKYLEREAKENRSKSNAIAVDNAGHYIYVSQMDFCLKEAKEFMTRKMG